MSKNWLIDFDIRTSIKCFVCKRRPMFYSFNLVKTNKPNAFAVSDVYPFNECRSCFSMQPKLEQLRTQFQRNYRYVDSTNMLRDCTTLVSYKFDKLKQI